MHTEYSSEYSNKTFINPDASEKSNKFLGFLWKILLVIIVLILLFLALIKFGVISLTSSVMPTAILLNQNEVGIKKGKSYQLVSTVLPENANNKQVVWESSDPSIVKVNEVTGYITALKEGTTTITAKTSINDIATDCIVNVTGKNILITRINLNTKNINLAVGYTRSLNYTIYPSNATENNLLYSSSDSSVVTVNSKGVVKGIKEGSAIITVSSSNGMVKDTAYVTVYNNGVTSVSNGESVNTIYPSSLKLNNTNLNLKINSSVQIIATITPSGANQSLSWSSSNTRVATVNSNGLVEAKGTGTTNIVAQTVNGITAKVTVTVGDYSLDLKGIMITTNYALLPVGSQKQLVVVFEPSNASNKTVSWSSSNPDVATVNSSGYVKAISSGSTTITAKSLDGGYTDTTIIEVGSSGNVIDETSVSFPKSIYYVGVGGTITLNPIITPSNATFKNLMFSSSDSSIASVDNNGLVSGLKKGEVKVTVTTHRKALKATATVVVNNIATTGVTLNSTNVSIKVRDTYTLVATVLPSDASDKTVKFSSNDPSIASVDNNGIITGVKKGTTTITITPNGGGKASVCFVTVN